MQKILHISTAIAGGAATAALRQHLALLAQGADSKMLYLLPDAHTSAPQTAAYTAQPTLMARVRTALQVRLLPQAAYQLGVQNFMDCVQPSFDLHTLPQTPYKQLHLHPWVQAADVLNLHFVGKFLDYRTFFAKIRKPLVWTLHDMNAFTGTCHYTYDCLGYQQSCQQCPQLKPTAQHFAQSSLRLKQQLLTSTAAPLHIVTPSAWLGSCAQQSPSLQRFPHHIIRYAVDLAAYCPPANKVAAQQKLGLDPTLPTLLFVAESLANKRKGFELLLDALHQLPPDLPLQLLAVGSVSQALDGLPFAVHCPGRLHGVQMAAAYQAADLFVIPSLYDNFPNTVVEAYACGLPVLGFAASGVAEMLEPMGTHGSCPPYKTAELASHIATLMQDAPLRAQLGKQARAHAEAAFAPHKIAADYLALYQSLAV